jgi:uncharacterized protein
MNEKSLPMVADSRLPSLLAAQPVSVTYDCDCACAWTAPLESGLEPARVPYVRTPETRSVPLSRNWQAVFNPAGPIGIAVLNQPIREVMAAFETPAMPQQGVDRLENIGPEVARQAIGSLIRAGLLQRVGWPLHQVAQPATLSAWLHVTQACNLACRYCYVHKRTGAMSAEVGRSAVDRLAEVAVDHGYTTLKLKYAGGEPTLNFAVVEAIHDQAVHKAGEAGLKLEEVILSNGVGVSDAMLDSMAKAGMRLMVSLDGDADGHDRVRTRRTGGSPYAASIGTVDRALARGLRPSISVTITSLNLDGIAGAVAFALERSLPFNLNFYRECSPAAQPLPGKGASEPSSLVPDATRLTSTLQEVLSLIRMYPTYPCSLSSILDRTRLDTPHSRPCSAGRDYLVIDSVGRVSACQMLLGDPWSDLACRDPLSAVRRRGTEVFQPVREGSTCQTCAWRTACSGGCPLLRQTASHNRYCQVYRNLFPELIRLEGTRLLTHQS